MPKPAKTAETPVVKKLLEEAAAQLDQIPALPNWNGSSVFCVSYVDMLELYLFQLRIYRRTLRKYKKRHGSFTQTDEIILQYISQTIKFLRQIKIKKVWQKRSTDCIHVAPATINDFNSVIRKLIDTLD